MWITYRAVQLQMVRVTRWSHRAVYSEDGVDFLYDHVVLGGVCVLHPAATRSNSVTGKPVVGGYGERGAVSLRDLRTYMMQPRGQLQVRIGNEIILESPQYLTGQGGLIRPMACDAKNGPQPIDFQVLQVFGNTKTLSCYFEIATYINDHLHKSNAPAILSNRWTVRESYDELGFDTRHYQGRVVFRADFLRDHDGHQANLQPDDFRQKFHFPIPDNYYREGVEITQSSDGTTLDYAFRDVRQPTQLDPSWPVRRFKGHYVWHDAAPSMFWYATRKSQVILEVWGRPGARRQALLNFVAKVAAEFGFDGLKDSPRNYHSRTIQISLWDLYVRVDLSVEVGGAVSTNWTLFRRRGLLGFDPDVVPVDVSPPLLQDSGPNPGLGAFGVRGFDVPRLVSQLLTKPARVPPAPPGPEAAKHLHLYGADGY